MRTATIDALHKQKEQCLHMIEIDKALTRLEANKDFKDLTEFLFNESLLSHAELSCDLMNDEEVTQKHDAMLKALARTKSFIKNIHNTAEACVDNLPRIDAEIIKAEAEE